MAQANVLLFNFEGARLQKVRSALAVAKLRCAVVEKSRFGESLGALAGLTEDAPVIPEGVAELEGFDPAQGDFAGEMLVFTAVNRKELDAALLAMNRMGARVALKAILTPDNVRWSACALHHALTSEHNAR